MNAETGETEQPVRRRLAWRAWVAVAVAFLVVAGVVTWFVVSSRQIDRISVKRDGALVCRGTTPRYRPVGFDEAQVLTVELVEGMRCRLPVRVVNDGSHAVRLDEVVLPYMGRGSAISTLATRLDGPSGSVPLSDGPEPGGSDVDAHFELADALAPGEGARLVLLFEFVAGGCVERGGTVTLSGVPTVSFSVMQRGASVALADPMGFRGTKDSKDASC
ncbi:MAG: hypothetical protein H0X12_02655 [Nocardioides sp.]|nr:hypothetical protein [Nocardioides sp.]